MARKAGYDRDKVLDKALELFWSRGYHGTSLKDLEVALDMRPGSIYAAFGSKEALFAQTLRLYADRSEQQFHDTMAAARTPLTGLAAHVRALGCPPPTPAPSRACMLVKTLLETPNDPELRDLAEEQMRRIEASFAAAFYAAQVAGELAADRAPDLLASRLQAGIFGLRAYAQRGDTADRIAALAEDMAAEIEALARA